MSQNPIATDAIAMVSTCAIRIQVHLYNNNNDNKKKTIKKNKKEFKEKKKWTETANKKQTLQMQRQSTVRPSLSLG